MDGRTTRVKETGISRAKVREYFTPKAVVLASLMRQESSTFSELLKNTSLPKKTLSKYLRELLIEDAISAVRDSRHKQKIHYSITQPIPDEIVGLMGILRSIV
ncbi:MAG: hypothetical protein KGH71_02780 [Candidatus Micrarchaeota archaeon]|nr:hypothetical protein [Candidatus Micrarchaeota archaeon]